MAWDKTLPTNSTKIRNYPTVLTDNFAAVEEGDDSLQMWKINLIERNAIPSAPSATPTRIDNTMQLFSRQDDTNSETELFVLDDRSTAQTIQLTENGKLGAITQSLSMQDFTFDASKIFDHDNIVIAWCLCPSTGSGPTYGSGVASTSRTAAGRYTITWDANLFDNENYIVLAMGVTNTSVSWDGSTKTVTSFKLEVRNTVDGSDKDSQLMIVAVGGQA